MDKLNLEKLAEPLAGLFWTYILPAAIAIVVLLLAMQLFRRRRRAAETLQPELKVEVAALPDAGPPAGPPTLEFYNLPVRLAAVVLAPVGLGRQLPSDDLLSGMLDAVVPGLDSVAALHRPLVRRWPNQLSARGFAHLFFKHARLPGVGGKGTPWSSAAGIVKFGTQPIMVGLVLRAAGPNSLGQTIIEAEHQWLGCLRVRWD
jgi:hypothetical protein